MNKLIQFMRKEQIFNKLKGELEELSNDEDIKKEIEFKNKIDEIIKEYGKDPKDVAIMLDPDRSTDINTGISNGQPKRKKRKLKIYKNPETEEVIETRGGNNKKLKEWKSAYGDDVVEGWVTETD